MQRRRQRVAARRPGGCASLALSGMRSVRRHELPGMRYLLSSLLSNRSTAAFKSARAKYEITMDYGLRYHQSRNERTRRREKEAHRRSVALYSAIVECWFAGDRGRALVGSHMESLSRIF